MLEIQSPLQEIGDLLLLSETIRKNPDIYITPLWATQLHTTEPFMSLICKKLFFIFHVALRDKHARYTSGFLQMPFVGLNWHAIFKLYAKPTKHPCNDQRKHWKVSVLYLSVLYEYNSYSTISPLPHMQLFVGVSTHPIDLWDTTDRNDTTKSNV